MTLQEAKNSIRNAFLGGRLSHGYLFSASPDGAGKDLAIYTMQLISCREKDSPCLRCATCRQIAEKKWCDAFWLYPVKKSRIISIDQMRRGHGVNEIPPPYFLPWLSETSFTGGWKFGIVSWADRMAPPAANAFLKTLEEPPGKTMLLLLTDAPEQLLPTIRSRCSFISIAGDRETLPKKYLDMLLPMLSEDANPGPLAAGALAAKIGAILAQMQKDAEEETAQTISGDEGAEYAPDREKAMVSALYRKLRRLLVVAMQNWHRDVLVAKSSGGGLLNYPGYGRRISAIAAKTSMAQAFRNIEAMEGLERQLERSIPENAALPYWLETANETGGRGK